MHLLTHFSFRSLRVSFASERHRGFAYVTFDSPSDAAAALENMNDSELYGRVLKCNVAKPASMKGSAVWVGEAADEW